MVFAAVRPAGSEEFLADRLVFAGPNETGVCPCCPTETRFHADGTVLVAYRSQVDGYRDTWICRGDPGTGFAFSAPVPVVPPTWKFDGCPHDGPSLAISQEWVHVAWMDAHTGRQRVYYGRAKWADLKFTVQELHSAGPGTQGNPKLCLDAEGRLHAVWEESLQEEPLPSAEHAAGAGGHHHSREASGHGVTSGAGRAIMYACSPRADGQFESPQPVSPKPGHFQIRPAVAAGNSGKSGSLVAAWMEISESGKRLVVTTITNQPLIASATMGRLGGDGQ
jgi:hypothetical protein